MSNMSNFLHTEYDQLIWFVVAAKVDPQRKGNVLQWAVEQDRRDASLMFEAQWMRRIWRRYNPLIAGFDDTDNIDIGGSLRNLWCAYPRLNPYE